MLGYIHKKRKTMSKKIGKAMSNLPNNYIVAMEELQEKNSILIEEIETLNKIIKEAINLPKGIEPHSYSDYKINKQLN